MNIGRGTLALEREGHLGMDIGRETLRHGHWKRDTRSWTLARDTWTRALEEEH